MRKSCTLLFPDAGPGPEPGPGKVLFVDDDVNLLDALWRSFCRSFDVRTASGGDEALRMLATSGPVDVIVSDVRMPGMSGITLLSRVRELYPDTVRIVLTGYADLQNAMDAVNECQAFRILSKPCPTDMLRQVLDAAMEQRRLVRDQIELAVLRKHKQAMEGIIGGFCRIVEARDPYTAGHQRKVAELAVAIGQDMGFDVDQLAAIRLAALVHDIGKIYVPAEFLNKPGKLSDLEFAIIKQHPLLGHEILSPIDFGWPIARFVLEHHERLDGSGYPNGLSGDAISIEARVLAVADTVDAMTSNRPYRPAMGLELALDEIEKNRGKLYDPEVVASCQRLFREEDFQFDEEG